MPWLQPSLHCCHSKRSPYAIPQGNNIIDLQPSPRSAVHYLPSDGVLFLLERLLQLLQGCSRLHKASSLETTLENVLHDPIQELIHSCIASKFHLKTCPVSHMIFLRVQKAQSSRPASRVDTSTTNSLNVQKSWELGHAFKNSCLVLGNTGVTPKTLWHASTS